MRSPSAGPRPARWAALAAACLLAAGCAGATSGTAITERYQPVSIDSAAVIVAKLPPKTLAVSPDMQHAVVRTDDEPACLVPLDAPDEVGACADLPDDATGILVTFSPDGSRYSVLEDVRSRFSSGLWIVDSATGATRYIDVDAAAPGGSSASSAGQTGSRTPLSSTNSTSPPAERSLDPMQFQHWRSDSELIGVTGSAVLRIDALSGRVTTVATVQAEQKWVDMAAFGAAAVALLRKDSVTVVNLESGTISAPITVTQERGSRPLLLGISSDGTRILVSTTNPQQLTPGPTWIISADDQQKTKFDLPATTSTFAGAFSPDDSQVLLVTYPGRAEQEPDEQTSDGQDPDDQQIQLVAATGGTPRVIGTTKATVFGALGWSRQGVVTSTTPMAPFTSAFRVVG